MHKQGKIKLMGVLGIVAIILAIVASGLYIGEKVGINPKLSQGEPGTNDKTPSAANMCPTTGATNLIVDVQNYLNTTGTEGFDVTAYLISKESGNRVVLTDTTGPTASSVNCGETYTLEVVRSNSDDGDNSRIATIISGPDAEIIDGTLEFTPKSANYNLRVGVSQHGVMSFQSKDNDVGDYMCNNDDTCLDFETDGVSFVSTTNGTAKAIGTDGWLDTQIKVRSTRSDTDATDYYTLMMVEAPLATWQEPSVKINGASVANVKGKNILTAEEETAYAGYEYVFKIDNRILDGNDGLVVDFYMQAKSGVNPSVDPEVDFVTAGRFLSLDGVTSKIGAADDTSSNSAVYDVQDITYDIS